MKRLVILSLVCLVFIQLVVAGAPELVFQHNETQPDETMLGIISLDGEWISGPTKSSFSFFEDSRDVFIEFDIVFFEDDYYLYIYPVHEGEYELVISDMLYKENEVLQSSEINYFFNVSLGTFEEDNETAIDQRLGIKPGFLLASEGNEIVLSNKGIDVLNVTYGDEVISLESFESRTVEILFSELFSYAIFSTYKEFQIPLINLFGNETNTTREFISLNLKSDTELLTANSTLGEDLIFNFTLFNFDDNNLTEISFSSSLDIFDFPEFNSLDGREEKTIEIEISPENPGRIIEELIISYVELGETHNLKILVDLFVYPAGTSEEEFGIVELNCEELGGSVCSASEVCTGDATFAKGGVYCCLDSCSEIVETKSDSSTKMIIGIVIFLALGIGGYFLWKKSKKVKPVSGNEVLDIASKNYNSKMSGAVVEPKKVSGKIEKG